MVSQKTNSDEMVTIHELFKNNSILIDFYHKKLLYTLINFQLSIFLTAIPLDKKSDDFSVFRESSKS